jgi:predicted RNA-binding protein with PIN domain
MMRHYCKWILSLATGAMLTVTAQAVDKPIAEVEIVELLLLRQHSVQTELKIGKDEAAAIKDFTDAQHKKAVAVHKMAVAEQGPKYDKMATENDDFLKSKLTPTQSQRLRQIAMQRAGLLWVSLPDVAKKLKLSEKQIEQIQAEQKKARKETDDALSAEAAQRDKKLKELHDSSNKRLHSILTPEQAAMWKDMVGVPFEGVLLVEDHATAAK